MDDLTPITRKEHFLSRAAGGPGLELKPNTREEHFLAAIAGSGPSPGPGGEVTPASIVTATGQMTAEQKAQTRGNLAIMDVPVVSASDNGKFMRVISGVWTAATVPSAETASF